MDSIGLFLILYFAPCAICLALCRERLVTCLGLAIITFGLSCASMPLGVFVPWMSIPVFGATRYLPYKEEAPSKCVLKIAIVAAAFLAVMLTVIVDSVLEPGSVKQLNASGAFFTFPLFLSSVQSGDPFIFGRNGYLAGVAMQLFTLCFFFILVMSMAYRRKLSKARIDPAPSGD